MHWGKLFAPFVPFVPFAFASSAQFRVYRDPGARLTLRNDAAIVAAPLHFGSNPSVVSRGFDPFWIRYFIDTT